MRTLLIAVVDDDAAVRESIVALLASAGYATLACASAEAFLETACAPACLVLDRCLPGMSGPDLRDRLRAKGDRVPVVMISAHAYDDCLRKPFDGEVLLGAVRHATERTSN